MNNYKGLFTFDVDNHRYIPVEQADGLISDMNYHPEPKEEPKKYWVVDYITCGVDDLTIDPREPEMDDFNKEIGNYFSTKEEAEKAVEKLKAWKRLKDARVRFDECRPEYQRFEIYYVIPERDVKEYDQIFADIYLLFGGEE